MAQALGTRSCFASWLARGFLPAWVLTSACDAGPQPRELSYPPDATGGTPKTDASDGAPEGTPMELPARGLFLESIAVNQGVNVTLGRGGVELPLDQREAVVVHSRRMLVQARVVLADADAFEPRPIIARLYLYRPGGAMETREQERVIFRDSDPDLLDTNFSWVLEPGDVEPGLTLAVELFEIRPPTDDDASLEPPRYPNEGTIDVGVEESDQLLRVTMVPVRHKVAGCDRTAPHDPETIEKYRQIALHMLPVQDVQIQVHPPWSYTEEFNEDTRLAPLLQALRALRANENPPPDVFYYGVLDHCGESPGSGGQGFLPDQPESLEAAAKRASVGRVYNGKVTRHALNTFVHEVSHNLGRRHVVCTGNEKGPDETYPHSGGLVGTLGWSVTDGQLRSRQLPEYMSYCVKSTQWQSDHGWNLAYIPLRALTSSRNARLERTGWDLLITRTPSGTVYSDLAPAYSVPHTSVAGFTAVTAEGFEPVLGEVLELAEETETEAYSVWLTDEQVETLERVDWDRGAEFVAIEAPRIKGLQRARSR